MGQNLTGKLIKDTYEDLVQISGSILTDGTGSNITNLTITASLATTASYAVSSSADNLTLQQVTDNGNTTTNSVVIGDGVSGTLLVGNYILPLTDGNANEVIKTNGSGDLSFTDTIASASFATTASATPNAIVTASLFGTNNNISFEKGDGSTFDLFIDDVPNASFATNATNAATASLANTASVALDLDAAAQISISSISASNATFVSASIGYLTAVTGSVTKIGDAFILLNTSDVTRYAGLLVEDSGSSTPINYTASFFFDSETNDWNYEYTSGSTDYGVALFGPTYNTKGVPTYLTANTLPKAEGTHHLIDSIISDDGSVVTVSGNVEATAITASAGFSGDLVGTASFASQAGTAGFSSQAGTAGFASTATSASWADQAGTSGFAVTASFSTTASYAESALSASFAQTASYALNAEPGFPYTGSAEISGSLRVFVSGSADGYTITSGSISGSLIDNLTTPTASEAIKHLVYLSQAEYDALTPDTNTMYVISGSGDVVENLTVSGSLVGEVQTLSISSNTASMDLSTGNFFTLQLVGGTDTRIEPSNIQAGQTINLLVSTTGSATVSFPSAVKQVSGSAYVPTTTTSKDVVTFISFNNSEIYLSNVKNLV